MNRLSKVVLGLVFLAQSGFTQTVVRPLDPKNPPPVVPAPPPKKILDAAQLERVVRQAAQNLSRYVIDTLGEAYQVRYNVREGVLRGMDLLGDIENPIVLQSQSEYREGLLAGQEQGQSAGAGQGRSDANSRAYSVASSEIERAIDQAIDSQRPIQFKPQARLVEYNGASSNLSVPRNVESRLMDDRSSKESQMRRLLYRLPPSEYLRGLFDLSDIYRFHVTQIPSSLRGDNIFETWLRNDLDLPSSLHSEGERFYREITNSSLYEQAIENGNAFKRAFRAQFNNSNLGGNFERQWSRTVTASNPSARNLGERFYVTGALEFAREKGYFAGYNPVFRSAAVGAFNSSYNGYYNSNYSSIEQRVRTTSLLTDIHAELVLDVPESDVTYGDTLSLRVMKVTNRGMMSGNARVAIETQPGVTSFEQPDSLTVQGLTRLAESKLSPRLAWISDLSKADQTVRVGGLIHNQRVTKDVVLTYEALLKKIIRTDRDDLRNFLLDKALVFMKTQWDEMSGFSDQYANREPRMLLVRMKNLMDTLPDSEKQIMRTRGQLIRDIFGGKPPRFLNPKRDDWDATQALINEMGLEGKVPEYVYPN